MNNLDEIEARVRDCATYNFGMRNADTLAHHDAPYLLDLVRKQQAALEAAKAVAETWDEYPSSPEGRCARELRTALEAGK